MTQGKESMTEDTVDLTEATDDDGGEAVRNLEERFTIPDIRDAEFWEGEIRGATEKWKQKPLNIPRSTGYKKNSMFSEDKLSLGKLIHVGHKLQSTEGRGNILPDTWLEMFNNAKLGDKYDKKDNTALQVLAICLALTDPVKEFGLNDKGILFPANHHFA